MGAGFQRSNHKIHPVSNSIKVHVLQKAWDLRFLLASRTRAGEIPARLNGLPACPGIHVVDQVEVGNAALLAGLDVPACLEDPASERVNLVCDLETVSYRPCD